MTRIRIWLRAVFGFSRAESNGFIILLPLLIILVSIEPFSRYITSSYPDDFSKESATLDSLSKYWTIAKHVNNHVVSPRTKSLLFVFNPNDATEKQLESLGFSARQRSGLMHYRERGGKLRTKGDLMKIYGMDSTLYKHLLPFIQLPDKYETKSYSNNFTSKKEPRPKFELNSADTTELKSVFGIGTKLATRIVKYRARLGGFINVNQLDEVYGLDTMVIHQLLKVSYLDSNFETEKININQITGNEFNIHPYLDKKLAKALATYRFQHGDFKQVEEIRSLQFITTEIADKIIPYLKVY